MTMSFGLKSLHCLVYECVCTVWRGDDTRIPSRRTSERRKNVFFQLEFKFHDFISLSFTPPRHHRHSNFIHTNSAEDTKYFCFFFCEKSFPFTLGRIFLFFILCEREKSVFISLFQPAQPSIARSSACFDKRFRSMDSRLLLWVIRSRHSKEKKTFDAFEIFLNRNSQSRTLENIFQLKFATHEIFWNFKIHFQPLLNDF